MMSLSRKEVVHWLSYMREELRLLPDDEKNAMSIKKFLSLSCAIHELEKQMMESDRP